jgi:cell wall-associated NlpC family hydrolase
MTERLGSGAGEADHGTRRPGRDTWEVGGEAVELERSAELIERLLGDPELRRRFRADPASVLREHGLRGLATGLDRGERALLTLELRESRSSLAGVMVAAAAEGVDFTHLAERAAPGIEHGAGRALDHLVSGNGDRPRHVEHAAPAAPAPAAPKPPSLVAGTSIPALASPPPAHHSDHPELPQQPAAASATRASQPPAGADPGSAAGDQASRGTSQDPADVGRGSVGPGHAQSVVGQGQVGDTHAPGGTHAAGSTGGRGHAQTAGADPGDLQAHPTPDLLRYPGDDATPEQVAAWMGANAKRAGLPPELPVMASLVESTLHNLSYGDRDSVGFFQMRLGIWNNGPYAGYLQNPDLQIKWFIDHALEARQQDPALAQSPTTWGEWVANVEQPAAQYRYRYQLQLATAQQLLNGVDLTPAPVPHIPVGEAAVKVAMDAVGSAPPATPGAGPATGGAGLVQYAYGHEGVNLPGVPAEQFDVGMPVAKHSLRPGDAVFFADHSGFVHHVGLYVGGGRFVSAPGGGGHVEVGSLSDPRLAEEYIGARRYTESALTDPKHYARTLPAIKG